MVPIIGKILDLLKNEGKEVPETARDDFLRLIGIGQRWIDAPEEKKEKIKKFRNLLKKAYDYGNSLTITWDSSEGPIQVLHPFDYILLPLAGAVEDCNTILGTSSPRRYPRKKIVRETLDLWTKYTGKRPQKCAVQPSPYSGDKEAPPYALCRLVLTAIEGEDPGDFHRIYESAVNNLPQK